MARFELSRRIEALLHEKRLLRQDVADKAGIQRSHFSTIVNGHFSNVGWDKLEDIIHALGVSVEEFFCPSASIAMRIDRAITKASQSGDKERMELLLDTAERILRAANSTHE